MQTYLTNGTTLETPTAKQLANRKQSKASRGIDRCMKKLARRAGRSPEAVKQQTATSEVEDDQQPAQE